MNPKLVLLGLVFATQASAQYLQPASEPVDALKEYRQCGKPARNADGSIKRRADVLTAYRKIHPCPVTGLSVAACPGWQINHVIPLAKGGCDAVSNLMWLPVEIKTCTSPWCVDRWERTYYGSPHGKVIWRP